MKVQTLIELLEAWEADCDYDVVIRINPSDLPRIKDSSQPIDTVPFTTIDWDRENQKAIIQIIEK